MTMLSSLPSLFGGASYAAAPCGAYGAAVEEAEEAGLPGLEVSFKNTSNTSTRSRKRSEYLHVCTGEYLLLS